MDWEFDGRNQAYVFREQVLDLLLFRLLDIFRSEKNLDCKIGDEEFLILSVFIEKFFCHFGPLSILMQGKTANKNLKSFLKLKKCRWRT